MRKHVWSALAAAMLSLPSIAVAQANLDSAADHGASSLSASADLDRAPTCDCQDQCDAMWVQATNSIQNATGMRLRTTTDFMLETFVSRLRVSGSVVKRPLGNGVYEIKGTISAPNMGDAAYSGRRAFNQDLLLAKEQITCPAHVEKES